MNTNRRGFTRTDLIVIIVTAVIGFSILTPLLLSARETRRRASMLGDMRPPMSGQLPEVQELMKTVVVQEIQDQPKIVRFSIPIDTSRRGEVNGGMLHTALFFEIERWTNEHNLKITEFRDGSQGVFSGNIEAFVSFE